MVVFYADEKIAKMGNGIDEGKNAIELSSVEEFDAKFKILSEIQAKKIVSFS